MRRLALPLLLLLAVSAGPAFAQPKGGLELTVKPLGWGEAGRHFPAGRPIPLQLVLTNHGTVSTEVRLKDHGKDGGQEPLWGVAARVSDKTGKLLTRDEHDLHADDWWSSALASDCTGKECEMAGDRVSIPPGQTVLRKTDLGALIANCPGLARGLDHVSLPAGTYTVQLSLNGLISAPVQIVVD
ncbi:MAG TPA: hypothetical protein VF173_27850 [Thermoanaerobaculia bacterium]|nr:hypothetical protein [Thermoanaerobaculia bacterium]